jgi:2-polyprenyl-6-methoxyphenol hydroxylase-like FAD-dependent oxidoreductase
MIEEVVLVSRDDIVTPIRHSDEKSQSITSKLLIGCDRFHTGQQGQTKIRD